MSSPHLPATSPAQIARLLPEVVVEVAEHAFYAWAEPCETRRFEELTAATNGAMPTIARWISARVEFKGVVNGSLEVVLPEVLASELGVSLTGGAASDGLTDHELGDVAGELANMLCGVLLTRVDRSQPFELWPPEVARTAGVRDTNGRFSGSADELLFALNDRPVVVRFDVCAA